jgi:hypothetical protein
MGFFSYKHYKTHKKKLPPSGATSCPLVEMAGQTCIVIYSLIFNGKLDEVDQRPAVQCAGTTSAMTSRRPSTKLLKDWEAAK